MVLATRLELRCSKDEILALYASHAPFGGNVVGLESAAWYYFGRSAAQLSWAECAMLAVLPNSPSLIHIRRNRERLREKRNGLLDRIWHDGRIDSLTCALAKQEHLPDAPEPMPMEAMYLLGKMREGRSARRSTTTCKAGSTTSPGATTSVTGVIRSTTWPSSSWTWGAAKCSPT